MTLLEVLRKSESWLAERGVPRPRLDAEWIFAHVLGCKRLQLYLNFERPLTEVELAKARALVKRRGQREPLQYVLGEWEFCGLKLKCDRRALIPRPETEQLVEALTELWPIAPGKVADLGTGTGALALALARAWPAAAITATDASPAALALAGENAIALGLDSRVRFRPGYWFDALPPTEKQCFDVLVSNPPYLSDDEVASAAPEVRDWEPRAALRAPREGLADLAHLLDRAPQWLRPGGLLALETGIAQHAELERLAQAAGYARLDARPDLSGRPRFFLAWR